MCLTAGQRWRLIVLSEGLIGWGVRCEAVCTGHDEHEQADESGVEEDDENDCQGEGHLRAFRFAFNN